MNLAIKGHKTRGAEVIEILKMLGGTNPHNYSADSDCFCFYVGKGIDDTNANVIYYDWIRCCYDDEEWIVFTLEEFLEKFPYKVGDKVQRKGVTSCDTVYEIEQIIWEYDQVVYIICDLYWKNIKCTVTTETLQPYKEETTVKQKKDYEEWCPINYLEFENNDDTWDDEVEVNLGKDYEIQIRGDKTFIVKKKPQYPKTYKECCEVLKIPKNDEHYIDIDAPLVPSDYNRLVSAFTKLLICRDAYWKIAGEEMGLGKPWKPDWDNLLTTREYIKINKGCFTYSSRVFVFPTKEMKDTFFENFKELIEIVKELL